MAQGPRPGHGAPKTVTSIARQARTGRFRSALFLRRGANIHSRESRLSKTLAISRGFSRFRGWPCAKTHRFSAYAPCVPAQPPKNGPSLGSLREKSGFPRLFSAGWPFFGCFCPLSARPLPVWHLFCFQHKATNVCCPANQNYDRKHRRGKESTSYG